MLYLWIDDVRVPPVEDDKTWVWIKTSKDTLLLLKELVPITEISLDHDLGGEDTTMPIVKLIEEQAFNMEIPRIKLSVHSQNPVGRKNLIAAIKKIDYYFSLYGKEENEDI